MPLLYFITRILRKEDKQSQSTSTNEYETTVHLDKPCKQKWTVALSLLALFIYNVPAVNTFSINMSLDVPSAIRDFSRVFIMSLEPHSCWAAVVLSSVTVWRHCAKRGWITYFSLKILISFTDLALVNTAF